MSLKKCALDSRIKMSTKAKASNDMTVMISLLTRKNYYTWIPIVRAHLRQNRLWKYTQEEFQEKNEEAKNWKEKATEAADAICNYTYSIPEDLSTPIPGRL